MKSFIFDNIIKKVKKYSENLDVKNILCEKPWIVFNDTGEKEVFIFRTDGSVLVTKNGEGVISTWEWIPTNKSLMINKIDQEKSIVILRPAFVNNTILALQLDGTEKYTFLIDENNKEKFAPKTLTELKQYFIALELKAIEAEHQRIIQEAKEEEERIENEKRRRLQEAEDDRIAEENKKRKKIYEKKAQEIAHPKSLNHEIFAVSCISIIIFAVIITIIVSKNSGGYLSLILLSIIVTIIIVNTYKKYRKRYFADKYIREHPNDPVNNHLKQFLS